MHDYAVYFATLILGVAIFYVFNAMDSQTVMMDVSKSTQDIIKLMNTTMSAISVFVSFVLGFLIIYASNFLMKRRKKEFAVYMILGMGRRRIAGILLIETILIGALSLVIGVCVGVAASQGMSVVVANMFEADMTQFQFVFSEHAFVMTVIYFVIMYLVVMVFNTLAVSRTKLINLLNAHKKGEKHTAKNPVFCMIVFLVSAVVLGSAYYNVTANVKNLTSEMDILMQIVKGIITTFLIFWSLSGLLMFAASRNKKFYYKKLNCFTVKELASRINTTVFSGSIICLMLFITICVLSSATSIKKSINDNLKELVPMDLNLIMNADVDDRENFQEITSISEIMERTDTDASKFKDVTEFVTYWNRDNHFTFADTLGEYAEVYIKMLGDNGWSNAEDYVRENAEEVMHISDYNRVAKAYGISQYTLAEDEYLIVANFESMVEVRNEGLKRGTEISIGGKSYHPKYKTCRNGYIAMQSNHSNFGVVVLPDSADLGDFEPYGAYYLANFDTDSDEEYKKLADQIDSEEFHARLNPENKSWAYVDVGSRTEIGANSIGLAAMIVFIGIYLGIIFMIASAAILALKELSEASDNREKYRVLRKIGVDEHVLHRSLFTQSAMFFGLPLVFACVHSIFGIQTCCYILETFGKSGLLWSILVTAALILAVYGVYFVITYFCSRRIIKE